MTTGELARQLSAALVGDEGIDISGIASITSARSGDLVFADDDDAVAEAIQSKASAIICSATMHTQHPAKAFLVLDNPKLAFSRAAELILRKPAHEPGIHATAIVDSSAQISPDASIGPLCVVGADVKIGPHTTIGPGCVIADRVSIGSSCCLVARVTVYSNVTIGKNVTIHAGAVLGSDGFGFVRDPSTGKFHKFPQVGRLVIGDDVEIGANATVDRGALDETLIASGVKLDNLVHVGHNVKIGKNVVIAAQTGVSGSSEIGDDVLVGGQVGIADHVTIESGAILGAQAGIPSNKTIRGKGIVFWGTPARPIKEYLKELATLSRLARGPKK